MLQAASPPKQRRVLPLVSAIGCVVALLAAGAFVWFAGDNAKDLLADAAGSIKESISVFDSADAVIRELDQNDRELIRLAGQLAGGNVPQIRDQFVATAQANRKLLYRAVRLDPISQSEIASWSSSDEGATGPLDPEAIEKLVDQVNDVGDAKNKAALRSAATRVGGDSEFIREFLLHGHLELAPASKQGERLARERVTILREFTGVLASRVEKNEQKLIAESKKQSPDKPQPTEQSDEEIAARMDQYFGSITSDLERFARRLNKIAEERYELHRADVGDEDKYDEALFYARAANNRVFNRLVFQRGEQSKFAQAFKEFVIGMEDYDRATSGMMPTKLVAKAEVQAAVKQRERDRLAKIAAAKREQEQALARERDVRQRESMATPANTTPSTPENLLVQQVPTRQTTRPGSPFADRTRFGPADSFAGPSGVRRPSGPRVMRGPTFRGPQGPATHGANPGANRYPGNRFPMGPRSFPTPPPIDTSTGFTITMNDASGVSTRDLIKRFEPLSGRSRARISNNALTFESSYTGALDNVVELIDFGRVVSKDEATRTIVVERE